MTKKPWEEKVVSEGDGREENIGISRRTRGSAISTPLLTALLSIFFVIVVAILFVVFYTSNGGSDTTSETSNFYTSSTSENTATEDTASDDETTSGTIESTTASTSEDTTTSSSSGSGDTITVLSGEGAASIASRAGISVETLYALNPDHMTLGYWYANPGDEVYIN